VISGDRVVRTGLIAQPNRAAIAAHHRVFAFLTAIGQEPQPILCRVHARTTSDDALDLPAYKFLRLVAEDVRDAATDTDIALLLVDDQDEGAALCFRGLVVRQPGGHHLEGSRPVPGILGVDRLPSTLGLSPHDKRVL